MPVARRYAMIATLAELTGATDREIATLIGIPRSTVQAYRTLRYNEKLTDEQREKVLKAAQEYRQQVYEIVAEMELMS